MPETKRRRPAPPTDAPGDDDLLAGTPFVVLSRIGAGGMGALYEARHKALGKRVVVKLLHPQYASQPQVVERLKREARVLAQMASPHIVTVSDLGETAHGATFIAMERLYGHTLGQELRERGALPILEAIHWTREVLAGLAAAHRAGVVHRDVKLDNVFLCDATDDEPRRVKLLDFGIAKVLNDATAGMDLSRHQPTAEGTVIGSPRWLAPEQARGQPVDARTDVYAAGLLAYTLVAGRGPFAHVRDAIEAIEASLITHPAPPSRYAPQDVPPDLDSAILTAIEKAPGDRFQSAEAFSTALESIAHSLADATQPLAHAFVWRRAPAAPAPAPADEMATGLLPTLVRRPAGVSDLAVPEPTKGVTLGVFVALTAASTLAFLAVLTLIVHYAGGR
jgi:eukaryotic-like serine/threonine-protein kinase